MHTYTQDDIWLSNEARCLIHIIITVTHGGSVEKWV